MMLTDADRGRLAIVHDALLHSSGPNIRAGMLAAIEHALAIEQPDFVGRDLLGFVGGYLGYADEIMAVGRAQEGRAQR